MSPRVAALYIPGLKAWFNSNDHEPPHFHIEKPGRWECRIYFAGRGAARIERKWGVKGPTGKERRAIRIAAEKARDQLLIQWSEAVCIDSE